MIPTLALLAALQFAPSDWTLVDPDARATVYLNRESIYLNRGIALMNSSGFADGTIECDLVLDGHPAFAGIVFRAESENDYELIYVRPHRSRQPDAVQYTPIFRGQEAWQLYVGNGYTAAAELPLNRWVHLRLVVSGYTARLFIDNSLEPQLVVTDLKRPWARGKVGLWGRNGAHFSNVSVVNAAGPAPPTRTTTTLPLGTVTDWMLSPAFNADLVSPTQLPASIDQKAWLRVNPDSSGIVNLAQSRSFVSDGRNVVFAKATLRAERAGPVRLTFGYSDEANIFLNGRLIFSGNARYLLRDSAYLGTLTLGNDTLYLDLAAGENELVIAVVETFGGWGIAARVVP